MHSFSVKSSTFISCLRFSVLKTVSFIVHVYWFHSNLKNVPIFYTTQNQTSQCLQVLMRWFHKNTSCSGIAMVKQANKHKSDLWKKYLFRTRHFYQSAMHIIVNVRLVSLKVFSFFSFHFADVKCYHTCVPLKLLVH